MVEKFEGCLLGLAIGDSLGAPVEGWRGEDIRKIFGRLDRMIDAPWRGFRKGGITDDTSLMLCIARSICERGEFDPEDTARRFLNWLHEDGYGIGRTTFLALKALEEGIPWYKAGEVADELLGGKSAGNGSIMRCAPIALRYWRNMDKLREKSYESSIITHYDPVAREACFALNLIIAGILEEGGKDVINKVVPYIDEKVGRVIIEAENPRELVPSAFCLDTLKCSLWAFLKTNSFEEAIVEAVNLGGDTDTIGAVCGAISGAYYGREGIPREWLSELEVRDEVMELARRIYEMGGI